MTDLDEIQELTADFASDLASATPVDHWAGWIIYALKCLEVKAMDGDPDHDDNFEIELEKLQDVIADRLKFRRWPN